MTPKQKFFATAAGLSCGVFAGASLAALLLEESVRTGQASRSVAQEDAPLRPSIVGSGAETPAAWATKTAPADERLEVELRPTLDRYAFISPDLGEFAFEDETDEVDPESWSVEVQQLPGATQSRRPPSAGSRGTQAGKAPPRPRYTLKQRLAEISPAAAARIQEKFTAAKAAWPPAAVSFVAIKDEKALEVYARSEGGAWSFVHRYKVLAASGSIGPKMQRGDKQVPEGIYGISYLNPNSAYHVSLRVNYPNRFDREMAAKDGRKDLGGDIMIHGKAVSAGCLAVGDEAAEELFVLAAEVGIKNIKVVIAPTDFRQNAPDKLAEIAGPAWVPGLYTEIASAMTEFKPPPQPAQPSLLTLLGL